MEYHGYLIGVIHNKMHVIPNQKDINVTRDNIMLSIKEILFSLVMQVCLTITLLSQEELTWYAITYTQSKHYRNNFAGTINITIYLPIALML